MLAIDQPQISTAAQQSVTAELTSLPHRPMIQLSGKRSNYGSRITFVGQDTHADDLKTDAVIKTRLVEQLDLTTRKIINEKDQKIVELQTQV